LNDCVHLAGKLGLTVETAVVEQLTPGQAGPRPVLMVRIIAPLWNSVSMAAG
jgi:hypothetical protein